MSVVRTYFLPLFLPLVKHAVVVLAFLHPGFIQAVEPPCPDTLSSVSAAPLQIKTDRLVLKLEAPEKRNWTLWDLHGKQIGRILAISEYPVTEFGIVVTSRGQGYATEALYTLMRYYLEETGAREVIAHVRDYNIASLKLHKKLGYRLVAHSTQSVTLGITTEEFQAITQQVESLPPGSFFRNAAPEAGNPYFP